MSNRRGGWATKRILLTDHLPFVTLAGVVFFVLAMVLALGIGVFRTVEVSVWDQAFSVIRWCVLGYGWYLTGRLLPTYVAHGLTRRAFSAEGGIYLVVASAALALVTTLGYLVEGVLFRSMGWRHIVDEERLFGAPDQVLAILATYWMLYAVWTLAASFYREDGTVPVTLPAALVMVLGSSLAVGYLKVPVIGSYLERAELGALVTVGICAGSLLLGGGLTWSLVRSIPLRTKAG
ncbi:hypothetical protein [Actinopolymorpha pittospori]